LNPSVGRLSQGTHAVGWGRRENGERVRAYRTHPTCGLRLATYGLRLADSFAEPLTPADTLSPLPTGESQREGNKPQGLYLGRLGYWERLPQFGECPLPSPPPRGREQIAADSGVTGRLKKNARNINGRNFSGSLYRKADGANAASVFSDDL